MTAFEQTSKALRYLHGRDVVTAPAGGLQAFTRRGGRIQEKRL